MWWLLATHECMLKGDLHGFDNCFFPLSRVINRTDGRNLIDRTVLEYFAKMDLLHVLHLHSPPLLGSVFQQTM